MKYDVANRKIWFKGEILNVNDAKINVLAPTSQFGLNVFEGIPCYWNDEEKQLYAFRLDEHYDRLIRSAKLIQIDNPYSKDEMKKALVDVVKAKIDELYSAGVYREYEINYYCGLSGDNNLTIVNGLKEYLSSKYNITGLGTMADPLLIQIDKNYSMDSTYRIFVTITGK